MYTDRSQNPTDPAVAPPVATNNSTPARAPRRTSGSSISTANTTRSNSRRRREKRDKSIRTLQEEIRKQLEEEHATAAAAQSSDDDDGRIVTPTTRTRSILSSQGIQVQAEAMVLAAIRAEEESRQNPPPAMTAQQIADYSESRARELVHLQQNNTSSTKTTHALDDEALVNIQAQALEHAITQSQINTGIFLGGVVETPNVTPSPMFPDPSSLLPQVPVLYGDDPILLSPSLTINADEATPLLTNRKLDYGGEGLQKQQLNGSSDKGANFSKQRVSRDGASCPISMTRLVIFLAVLTSVIAGTWVATNQGMSDDEGTGRIQPRHRWSFLRGNRPLKVEPITSSEEEFENPNGAVDRRDSLLDTWTPTISPITISNSDNESQNKHATANLEGTNSSLEENSQQQENLDVKKSDINVGAAHEGEGTKEENFATNGSLLDGGVDADASIGQEHESETRNAFHGNEDYDKDSEPHNEGSLEAEDASEGNGDADIAKGVERIDVDEHAENTHFGASDADERPPSVAPSNEPVDAAEITSKFPVVAPMDDQQTSLASKSADLAPFEVKRDEGDSVVTAGAEQVSPPTNHTSFLPNNNRPNDEVMETPDEFTKLHNDSSVTQAVAESNDDPNPIHSIAKNGNDAFVEDTSPSRANASTLNGVSHVSPIKGTSRTKASSDLPDEDIDAPSYSPTIHPSTLAPTISPTNEPTSPPTEFPTSSPTSLPTNFPTWPPSLSPTLETNPPTPPPTVPIITNGPLLPLEADWCFAALLLDDKGFFFPSEVELGIPKDFVMGSASLDVPIGKQEVKSRSFTRKLSSSFHPIKIFYHFMRTPKAPNVDVDWTLDWKKHMGDAEAIGIYYLNKGLDLVDSFSSEAQDHTKRKAKKHSKKSKKSIWSFDWERDPENAVKLGETYAAIGEMIEDHYREAFGKRHIEKNLKGKCGTRNNSAADNELNWQRDWERGLRLSALFSDLASIIQSHYFDLMFGDLENTIIITDQDELIAGLYAAQAQNIIAFYEQKNREIRSFYLGSLGTDWKHLDNDTATIGKAIERYYHETYC